MAVSIYSFGTAMHPTAQESAPNFDTFYKTVFRAEHLHPLNVALHVLGSVAGLVWLVATPLIGMWVLVLLFPLVHAVPGLIGHRFLERNAAVGDIRVTRTDYSPLWFIAANHRMTWELLTRGKFGQ
jgi:hypothetical protein